MELRTTGPMKRIWIGLPLQGKGRGKPLPEGMEGFLEDVISKPPVAQRAGGISSLRFPFDVQH